MWLYLHSPIDDQVGYILSSGSEFNNANTGAVNIGRYNDGIFVVIRVRDTEWHGREWNTGNLRVPMREWFHLAVTWKMDGYLKAYRNGQLSKSLSPSNVSITQPLLTDNTMYLGQTSDQQYGSANAAIDELYIWIYQKNEAEIQELGLSSEYLTYKQKMTQNTKR